MSIQDIYRHTFAEINLDHLRHNCRALRALVSYDTFFCPMVKSYGYGHGDIEITGALVDEGVETVGVALVEEGIRLRKNGFKNLEILVFGVFDKLGARALINHGLTPVVSTFHQMEALQSVIRKDDRVSIHLKFNTGMFRLGFEPDQAKEVKAFIVNQSQLQVTGVCTHLSDGEDASQVEGRTSKQIVRFEQICDEFSEFTQVFHAFNSAGFLGEVVRGNASILSKIGVRPGLALYGVFPELADHPGNDSTQQELALKPVMTLKSEIAKYHHLVPGDRVSYGGHWQATKKSVMGVVPIGYADGYSRFFSNKGKMMFRGESVPVIGTVCMDYVMIDLSLVLGDNFGGVGEEVLLFGKSGDAELPVEAVAHISGTIPYELLTCIGRRVPRRMVNG